MSGNGERSTGERPGRREISQEILRSSFGNRRRRVGFLTSRGLDAVLYNFSALWAILNSRTATARANRSPLTVAQGIPSGADPRRDFARLHATSANNDLANMQDAASPRNCRLVPLTMQFALAGQAPPETGPNSYSGSRYTEDWKLPSLASTSARERSGWHQPQQQDDRVRPETSADRDRAASPRP